MDMPSSSLQDLAQRLLSLEAESAGGGASAGAAIRVCEKLGVTLRRFAGPEAFASLLRRAVALACADIPALRAVKVHPDGSLEGLEGLLSTMRHDRRNVGVDVVAHLLGLLVTFVGEPLTLRLVREGWQNVTLD